MFARNISFEDSRTQEKIEPTCTQGGNSYDTEPYLMPKSTAEIMCQLPGYKDLTFTKKQLEVLPDKDTYEMERLASAGFTVYNRWTKQKYNNFRITTEQNTVHTTTNGNLVLNYTADTMINELTITADGAMPFTGTFDLSNKTGQEIYLYETKQVFTAKEVITNNAITKFSIGIDGKPLFKSDENGVITIFPNATDYNISFINGADYVPFKKSYSFSPGTGSHEVLFFARNISFIDIETERDITPSCTQNGVTYDERPYLMPKDTTAIVCELEGYEDLIFTKTERRTLPDTTTYKMVPSGYRRPFRIESNERGFNVIMRNYSNRKIVNFTESGRDLKTTIYNDSNILWDIEVTKNNYFPHTETSYNVSNTPLNINLKVYPKLVAYDENSNVISDFSVTIDGDTYSTDAGFIFVPKEGNFNVSWESTGHPSVSGVYNLRSGATLTGVLSENTNTGTPVSTNKILADIRLGGDSQTRGETITRQFNIDKSDYTNLSVETVEELSGTDFAVIVERYLQNPGVLNLAVSVTVPLDLDAVDEEGNELEHLVGRIVFSGSKNDGPITELETANVYLQAENNLEINEVEVSGDNIRNQDIDDGDTVDSVKPGTELEIDVTVKNNFDDDGECSDSTNCDIENVELFLISDTDLDIEEDVSLNDIAPDEEETEEFAISIDDDIDEDEYATEIRVIGYDENGARHGAEIEFEIEVETENNALELYNVDVQPNLLQCGERMFNFDTSIRNVGGDDQDNAELIISIDELNIRKVIELEIESGDRERVYETIRLPVDLIPKNYQVKATVIADNGEETDIETMSLIVDTCLDETAPDEENIQKRPVETVETFQVITVPSTPQPKTKTVSPRAKVVERQKMMDDLTLIYLLIWLFILIFVLLTIFIVVSITRRSRRRKRKKRLKKLIKMRRRTRHIPSKRIPMPKSRVANLSFEKAIKNYHEQIKGEEKCNTYLSHYSFFICFCSLWFLKFK